MKKKLIFFTFIFLISIKVFAFINFEDIFFSEFAINYSSIISPEFLENNTTGTLDTPYFSGKAGINISNWLNIYAGVSFAFFVEQKQKQNHYSFVPLFFGIKTNIFPDYFVFPSVYFEKGISFSNYHYITMSLKETNTPWTADYYNLGLGINWKVNDIFTLILNFERPWLSFYEKDKNEIHIINAGLACKIIY